MKGSTCTFAAAGVFGGSFLVLAALAWPRYRSEMDHARERIDHLGSQVIQTACGSIEYTSFGEGYPLLVVHGNAGGFDQGMGLAQGYLEQGFQVIAPSRFGYLSSPMPHGATVAMQADAYACLLDALKVRQAAVLTSSAGVTSSVQFALRHPDRVSALVLHSPNAPGEVGLTPPPQPVFRAMLQSDFAFWALTTYFWQSMQSLVGVPKGFALTPEMLSEAKAALSSALPVSRRVEGMIFDTYVSNPEINQIPLEDVGAPTLVVSAVDDPMALHSGAQTLAERIPGARLLAVPDGGHLMLGHTEEVRAEVSRFVRETAKE